MKHLTLTKTHGWLGASLLATLLAGCATTEAPGVGDDSTAFGTVEGRVTDVSGVAVSGAAVTAAQVGADGELTTVSEGEVTTDADGSYSIRIPLSDGTPMSDIVVTAEGEGSVLVAGAVAADTVTDAGDIDAETTAEAEVFVGMVGDGTWDAEVMTTAGLMAMIDADVGAALAGEVAGSAEVSAVGDAVASAMTAADVAGELMASVEAEVTQQAQAFVTAAAAVEAALMTSGASASDAVAALSESLFEVQAAAMVSAAASVAAELELTAEAADVITEASVQFQAAVSVIADGAVDAQAAAEAFEQAAEEWGVAVIGAVQTELDAQQQLAMGAVFDAAAEAHGALEAELDGLEGEVAGNAQTAAEAFATFVVSFEGSEAVGGLSAEGMTGAEAAATAGIVGSAFSSFGLDLGFLSGITLGITDIDLSGDSIEVLAVEAGGTLSSLAAGGAGTSSGAFLASMNLGGDLGVQQIVEVASADGATLSALTTIDGDGAFFGGLALTEETTAEASAMVELISSGAFDASATTAGELQALVSASVAEAMAAAEGAAAAEVSAAFAMAIEARQELLLALGESQTTVDLAVQAMAEAQASLDEALFVAATQAESSAAIAAYAEAMATAWTDAGMDAVSATWVELVELCSTVTFSDELISDAAVSGAAQVEFALDVAASLEAGIGAELASFGVSSAGFVQLDALVAQLEVSLAAAGEASSGAEVESAIDAAFHSFRAGIVALLVGEAGSGFEATAMSTYANSVAVQGELLSSALSELDLSAGADAMVDLVLDFQATASGSNATNGMSLVAMSTTEIDAVASIVSMVTVGSALQ